MKFGVYKMVRIPLAMILFSVVLGSCESGFTATEPISVETSPLFDMLEGECHESLAAECEALIQALDSLMDEASGECLSYMQDAKTRLTSGLTRHGGTSTTVYAISFPQISPITWITTLGLTDPAITLFHEDVHHRHPSMSEGGVQTIVGACTGGGPVPV